jgi:putative ABC transport system permease protein
LRAGLVVAEVALALVLVTGAGLLIRSFMGLMNVDPGFQRERVLAAQVFVYGRNPTPAQTRAFLETTIERLSQLPAVQHAGAVSAMPFIESNINIQNVFAIVGRPPATADDSPRASLSVATPGYFAAMRIPLIAGRLLEDHDGPDSTRVIVISDSMARRYWADANDAIGDRLRFRFTGTLIEAEIVGVVGALRHDSLDRAARDELFIPLSQMPFGSMTFVVRTAGEASALLQPVRETIWSVNPDQTIYRIVTLDDLVRATVTARRFALAIVVGFAVVALLLAVAGVYGVLSAIMTARLREVGLRVALGASRSDIVRLVLGRGFAMAGIGLVLGLAASMLGSQLLRSFLFGVAPADPTVIAGAAALMMLAALTAAYLPARRAAAANPIDVLRAE